VADGYPGNGRNLLLGVDLGGAFPGLTRRLTSSRGFLAARGSRPFHQLSVVDMHRSFEDAPGQVLQARRAVGGAEFSSPGHLSPLRGESVQPVGHSVWSIESGIEDSAYAGNDQSKKARWAGLKRGKESQLSGLQTTFEILFHPRHEVHLRVEIAAKVRKEHSIAPSLYNRTGRVDQHRPTSKLPSMPERTASRSVSITNRSWRVTEVSFKSLYLPVQLVHRALNDPAHLHTLVWLEWSSGFAMPLFMVLVDYLGRQHESQEDRNERGCPDIVILALVAAGQLELVQVAGQLQVIVGGAYHPVFYPHGYVYSPSFEGGWHRCMLDTGMPSSR